MHVTMLCPQNSICVTSWWQIILISPFMYLIGSRSPIFCGNAPLLEMCGHQFQALLRKKPSSNEDFFELTRKMLKTLTMADRESWAMTCQSLWNARNCFVMNSVQAHQICIWEEGQSLLKEFHTASGRMGNFHACASTQVLFCLFLDCYSNSVFALLFQV